MLIYLVFIDKLVFLFVFLYVKCQKILNAWATGTTHNITDWQTPGHVICRQRWALQNREQN